MPQSTISLGAAEPTPWLVGGLAALLAFFAAALVFTPWYIFTAMLVSMVLGVVILFRPAWGLHLLVLLVPVTPFSAGFVIVAPWNYFIFYRYADKIPLLAPLVPLTVAGLLFVKFARLKRISFRDPLLLASALLLGYAAVSLSWTANPGHSIFESLRFLLNVLLYLAVVSLVGNEEEHQALMWTWMLSMTIQCVIALGLFTYESVDSLYRLFPNFLFHFKVFGGMIQKTGAPTAAAGLQDFHETSLLTNMAAALAFGMLLNLEKRGKRFVLLIMLFLLFLFITMRTESRAGIGSMLVMLLMLALLLPRLQFRRIRAAVIFMLCAGLIYTATHIYLYTMTKVDQTPRMVFVMKEILGGGKLIDTAHKEKESGRMYMYKKSFRTLFANNPLRGLGAGNLKYLVQLPHAHSLYFSLVLDFGLAGLIFLAVLAKILFQRLYLVMKLPDSCAKSMALAAAAGLSGAAVHCLADFEYNYTSLWLLLGFVTSSCNAALSASIFQHRQLVVSDRRNEAVRREQQ